MRVVASVVVPERTVTTASISAAPVSNGVLEFLNMTFSSKVGSAGRKVSIVTATEELNELSFPAKSTVLERI